MYKGRMRPILIIVIILVAINVCQCVESHDEKDIVKRRIIHEDDAGEVYDRVRGGSQGHLGDNRESYQGNSGVIDSGPYSANTAYKERTNYLGARTQSNSQLSGREHVGSDSRKSFGANTAPAGTFPGLTAKPASIHSSSSRSSLHSSVYSASSKSHINHQTSTKQLANFGSITHPNRQLIINEHAGSDSQRNFGNNRSPPSGGASHYQANFALINTNRVPIQQKTEQSNFKLNIGGDHQSSSNRGAYQPKSHLSLTGHSINKIRTDDGSENSLSAYSVERGANIHRYSSINTPAFHSGRDHTESRSYLSSIGNINGIRNIGSSSRGVDNNAYSASGECHHQASSASSASVYHNGNNGQVRNHIGLSRQVIGQGSAGGDSKTQYYPSSTYVKSNSESHTGQSSKIAEDPNVVGGSTSPVTFPTPQQNNLPVVANVPLQIAHIFQVPRDLYIPVAPYVVTRPIKNPVINPVPIPVPVPVTHIPPHLRGQQPYSVIDKSQAPIKAQQSHTVTPKSAVFLNVPQSSSETAKQPVLIDVQQLYPAIRKHSPSINAQQSYTAALKAPVNAQQFYSAKSHVPVNIPQPYTATPKPPAFVNIPQPYTATVRSPIQIIVPETPTISHQHDAGNNEAKQAIHPSLKVNAGLFGSPDFSRGQGSLHRSPVGNAKQELYSGGSVHLDYSHKQ